MLCIDLGILRLKDVQDSIYILLENLCKELTQMCHTQQLGLGYE